METLLSAYAEVKVNPSKESIRAVYEKYYQGKSKEKSYTLFCKELAMIHQQEKIQEEREKERAHHLESSYPSPCPRCGYQRKE